MKGQGGHLQDRYEEMPVLCVARVELPFITGSAHLYHRRESP